MQAEGEALQFWRRWSAFQGNEREGSIVSPFLYVGPFRLLKVFELENCLLPAEEPAATDFQHKALPLGAWVALFQETTPGRASGRRQGAPPLPCEAPTRGARTRGLPPRLRLGWTQARFSPTPRQPRRGEKLRDTQRAWRPSSSSRHVS